MSYVQRLDKGHRESMPTVVAPSARRSGDPFYLWSDGVHRLKPEPEVRRPVAGLKANAAAAAGAVAAEAAKGEASAAALATRGELELALKAQVSKLEEELAGLKASAAAAAKLTLAAEELRHALGAVPGLAVAGAEPGLADADTVERCRLEPEDGSAALALFAACSRVAI